MEKKQNTSLEAEAAQVKSKAPKIHKKGFRAKGQKQEPKFGKCPKPWMNDPAWYSKYPELLQGVTNVANNSLPGTLRTASVANTVRAIGQTAGFSIPVTVTPGKNVNAVDPFNMQMKALWLELHRRYRGIGTYEYADLGITIFAIIQVYALIAEGERAYALAQTYKARNRMVPYALERIINWDFTSLNVSLANFRATLNRIIYKAQVLCLPRGMSIVDDVTNLFSNIFKDRNGVKSQFFAYYMDTIWTYNATTLSTGGALLGVPVSTDWTSTSYLLQLESLVDALVSDDDVARICSDILAAYSDDELIKLSYLPEDYTVEPVYDELRSLQFHNISAIGSIASAKHVNVAGSWPSTTDLVIYQESGNIISLFSGEYTQALSTYYAPVSASPFSYKGWTTGTTASIEGQVTGFACDTWHSEFTSDEIAELTRFHTIARIEEVIDTGATYEYICYLTHGVYIPHKMKQVVFVSNINTRQSDYEISFRTFRVLSTATDGSSIIDLILGSQIDNAPLVYAIENDGEFNTPNNFFICGDIDNLIYIKESDLEQIHSVCVLSEFALSETILKR